MQVNDQLTLTAPTANTSLFAYQALYHRLLHRRPRVKDKQEKLKVVHLLQCFYRAAVRLRVIQSSLRPYSRCSPPCELPKTVYGNTNVGGRTRIHTERTSPTIPTILDQQRSEDDALQQEKTVSILSRAAKNDGTRRPEHLIINMAAGLCAT